MIPLRAVVAMAHVKSVPASIEFYKKLGFDVGNTFSPDDQDELTWAWLTSGRAQFMVTKASEPVIASQQAVLFYVYCDDVLAKRAELEQAELSPGVVQYPFYAPRGEFRIQDPDGYVLMITHT
ncbi:VOC family protein [bacterium]|nr:VOC family protein [bacterium]